MNQLSGDELMAVKNALHAPAEKYGNDVSIEMEWARRAGEHSEIHFSILQVIPDVKLLILSPYDNEIYTEFRKKFPSLQVQFLHESDLKSESAKKEWREFCEYFKFVEDYNFGTLLRLDASGDYGCDNTILVPRVQFLAIEIARNRENLQL